jgi:UDP-N-acetylmuramyl pentapeptide phosphotransferase/UDP-N-acetylglucosamine-1-phosphate transferase
MHQLLPNATVALLGVALLAVLPPLVFVALRRAGHMQTNFRGDTIPQSYGLVILLWSAVMFAGLRVAAPSEAVYCDDWLIAILGFGLLGLLDDTLGDRSIKGLGGHFRAVYAQRRITTGLIKAVGGLALALWIGWRLAPASLAWVMSGCVIALSSNAINLLDLRPGRAGAVFLVLSLPLILVAVFAHLTPWLSLVAIPTIVVWILDARARVMMGDAGSNLLGACLGLSIALQTSIRAQECVVIALAALHFLAEEESITAIIERNPILRRIDRFTGVR